MTTETRCGVTIYDKKRRVVRNCGAATTHVLTFGGDQLFAICPRHGARIAKAGVKTR